MLCVVWYSMQRGGDCSATYTRTHHTRQTCAPDKRRTTSAFDNRNTGIQVSCMLSKSLHAHVFNFQLHSSSPRIIHIMKLALANQSECAVCSMFDFESKQKLKTNIKLLLRQHGKCSTNAVVCFCLDMPRSDDDSIVNWTHLAQIYSVRRRALAVRCYHRMSQKHTEHTSRIQSHFTQTAKECNIHNARRFSNDLWWTMMPMMMGLFVWQMRPTADLRSDACPERFDFYVFWVCGRAFQSKISIDKCRSFDSHTK